MWICKSSVVEIMGIYCVEIWRIIKEWKRNKGGVCYIGICLI